MRSWSWRSILRRKKKRQSPDAQKPQPDGIAERVRFWEEQDRINQVLISRVIRQGELLTKHIAEHDNLPDLFSQHLKAALDLQSRQIEAELKKRMARRTKLPTRLAAAAIVISLMALAVSLWM